MKYFQTLQLLESLEHQVESHLHEAIVRIQNLPEELLLKPAANGGWSIAQNLEHLNSYGHYYLPYMKRAVENRAHQASETFRSSWLGNYFTKMMDPDTGKKKYKAFKNHTPAPKPDAYKVVAEFIQQQEDLLHYLRKARHVNIQNEKIPVSITRWIRLSLGDTFRFFIAHNERHIRQALRNLDGDAGQQEAGNRKTSDKLTTQNVEGKSRIVHTDIISAEELMLRTPAFWTGKNQLLNRLLGTS